MALWRCCRGRARAHQPPRAGALGHAKITGFGRWQLRSLNFARSIHRCAGDRAMQRGEWRESSAVGSRSGHPRVFPFSPPPSPRGFRRFVHSVDTHTNARTEVIEKQRQTTVSDAAQLQAARSRTLSLGAWGLTTTTWPQWGWCICNGCMASGAGHVQRGMFDPTEARRHVCTWTQRARDGTMGIERAAVVRCAVVAGSNSTWSVPVVRIGDSRLPVDC